MARSKVVLLGPQRHSPTLAQAVESLGVGGPLAAITAGWEEREEEDQELDDHLGGRLVNLRVYNRAEEVFARDPDLFAALRARHDRMRKLRELYRLQLAHALEAARELLGLDGEPELLEPERAAAIEQVRALDDHHARRAREVHAEFEERMKPLERPELARQREEVRALIDGTEAVCIAGGHVAVLMNRLRLFGLAALIGGRPLFAWAAGAMAVSERIVLFHDNPPQGAGDAEVLEDGLGLCRGVVALPHASSRMRLGDPTRVALFARRFAPACCAALDPRTRIDWDGERWRGQPGARCLTSEGSLHEVEAA